MLYLKVASICSSHMTTPKYVPITRQHQIVCASQVRAPRYTLYVHHPDMCLSHDNPQNMYQSQDINKICAYHMTTPTGHMATPKYMCQSHDINQVCARHMTTLTCHMITPTDPLTTIEYYHNVFAEV